MLDAERDNMRAAWIWAVQQGQIDLLAQAADGLGYCHEWRAAFDEGERAYQHAAAQLEARRTDSEAIRVLALLRAWQANFTRLKGDIAEAEDLLQQCLTLLARELAGHDTRAERAFVLLQRGLVASEGKLADARGFFEESLALYQALGRHWEASHALLWLGDLARYQGDFMGARQHFRDSLAIRTAYGDQRGIAEVLLWDSHAAAEIGQTDEAEELARRSYAMHADSGDAANRAFGLGELAVILMWAGKYEEASRALQQSLDLYRDLGNHLMHVYAQNWLAVAYLALGKYEAARALSQQAIVQARELRGAQSGLAFALHYAGWVALTLETYHEAETLLQESVALHRKTGNAGMLNRPLAHLSYTHWVLGDKRRAQTELLEVLQASVRQHTFLPLLLVLPTIALLLAEQGHRERAAELYTLTWRYPVIANAQNSSDTFGKRLDAVVAALPPDRAAAAQARGRELDLWATAATLEAELVTPG